MSIEARDVAVRATGALLAAAGPCIMGVPDVSAQLASCANPIERAIGPGSEPVNSEPGRIIRVQVYDPARLGAKPVESFVIGDMEVSVRWDLGYSWDFPASCFDEAVRQADATGNPVLELGELISAGAVTQSPLRAEIPQHPTAVVTDVADQSNCQNPDVKVVQAARPDAVTFETAAQLGKLEVYNPAAGLGGLRVAEVGQNTTVTYFSTTAGRFLLYPANCNPTIGAEIGFAQQTGAAFIATVDQLNASGAVRITPH